MELDWPSLTVMSLPAVTFDLLTRKSNKHMYVPKYICDQNLVKFPSSVFEIPYSQDFRDTQTHALANLQNGMPLAPFFNGGASIKTET